jgi:class 3 adenylate cyclase
VADLPTGTVTFLFTDIEGSTRLLRQLRGRYGDVLGEHRRLLRHAFDAHDGRVVDTQGDAFFVAFERAKDALAAALEAQLALERCEWPQGAQVRVRFGLHTGEAVLGDEGYMGLAVHRAARICAAGHGSQVLLSRATAAVIEDSQPDHVMLEDLGEHRLKDIERPERLFRAVFEGSSEAGRLPKELDSQPVKATPFAGQERELAAAAQAALRPRRRFFVSAKRVLGMPVGQWRHAGSLFGEALLLETRRKGNLLVLGALVIAAFVVNLWLLAAAVVFYASQVARAVHTVRFFHSPEGVGWKVRSMANIASEETLRQDFLALAGALVRAGRVARKVDGLVARAQRGRLAHEVSKSRSGSATAVWNIERIDTLARRLRAIEVVADRRRALEEETRRLDASLPVLRARVFDARVDRRVPEDLLADVERFASKVELLGGSLAEACDAARRPPAAGRRFRFGRPRLLG